MHLPLILTSLLLALPPQLSEFLSCEVAVNIVAMGSTFRLYGEMSMNAKQDMLFLALYGDNPQRYWYKTNLTVVVAPNSYMMLGIWKLQDGVCDLKTVSPDQIPPLTLPANSAYRGNKTVSGKNCEVWRVADPYPGVEYVDVSISENNIYLLESQAWTFSDGMFGVATTIALTKHNNSEPSNSVFRTPEGC